MSKLSWVMLLVVAPSFASTTPPPEGGPTAPTTSPGGAPAPGPGLAPRFAGRAINGDLAWDIAESHLLAWSYCTERDGKRLGDCIILFEQPAEEVFVARVVTAAPREASATAVCEGGYLVLGELTQTVSTSSEDEELMIGVDSRFRVLANTAPAHGVMWGLRPAGRAESTIVKTVSSTTMATDVYDRDGVWVDGSYSLQIASWTEPSCRGCWQAVDEVQDAISRLGDLNLLLTLAWDAGFTNVLVGGGGASFGALGAYVGLAVGTLYTGISMAWVVGAYTVAGTVAGLAGDAWCLEVCHVDSALEVEPIGEELGEIEDERGGGANPLNDRSELPEYVPGERVETDVPQVFASSDGTVIAVWSDGHIDVLKTAD